MHLSGVRMSRSRRTLTLESCQAGCNGPKTPVVSGGTHPIRREPTPWHGACASPGEASRHQCPDLSRGVRSTRGGPRLRHGMGGRRHGALRRARLARRAARAFDTANQRKHYFEAAVGDAIAEAVAAGMVRRESLWLQTKFTHVGGQDRRLPYDPRERGGTGSPVVRQLAPAPGRESARFLPPARPLGRSRIRAGRLGGMGRDGSPARRGSREGDRREQRDPRSSSRPAGAREGTSSVVVQESLQRRPRLGQGRPGRVPRTWHGVPGSPLTANRKQLAQAKPGHRRETRLDARAARVLLRAGRRDDAADGYDGRGSHVTGSGRSAGALARRRRDAEPRGNRLTSEPARRLRVLLGVHDLPLLRMHFATRPEERGTRCGRIAPDRRRAGRRAAGWRSGRRCHGDGARGPGAEDHPAEER